MTDPVAIRALAEEAERILNSDAFKTFVGLTRDRLIEDWQRAKTTEARENLWYKLEGLTELVTEMTIAVSEKDVLEYEEKKRRRAPLAETKGN